MKILNHLLGGILLIAGTCIGAGMLGLPVMTAAAGFLPTMGVFVIVWFFMTCASLAYLEVSLRFKEETNFISLAGHTLGPVAKAGAWFFYILFLYSLMAAYTAGGTTMLGRLLGFNISNQLVVGFAGLVFILPFAFFVYYGTSLVDLINRIFMVGLIGSFVIICITFLKTSPPEEFNFSGDPKYLMFCLPLLVTSFGYQTLIPTIKTYLKGDLKKLKIVILLGGLVPLVIYAVWEIIIFTLIPVWGEYGLVNIMHSGADNPAEAIIKLINVPGNLIHLFIFWFSFFALSSSFLGVGLGIFDFFSDGLKIHKTKHGRKVLAALTFGPPILYTMILPQGFLLALKYAGIFAAILLIIYPVLMAWNARYNLKMPGNYRMWGGKLLLSLTLAFGIIVALADVLRWLGVFPIPFP